MMPDRFFADHKMEISNEASGNLIDSQLGQAKAPPRILRFAPAPLVLMVYN